MCQCQPGNNAHESRILLADCPCASLARYVTRALRAQKCCCRLCLMDLGWHCPRPPPAETTINRLSPGTAKNGSSQETQCKVSSSCWFHVWCLEAKLKWRQKGGWFVKEKVGGNILSSGFLPYKGRMRVRVIERFVTIDIHPDPGDHPPFLLPPPPPQSPASATWQHLQKVPPRQRTHCF